MKSGEPARGGSRGPENDGAPPRAAAHRRGPIVHLPADQCAATAIDSRVSRLRNTQYVHAW